MKIKKLVPVLLVLVMAFALAACAANSESTENGNGSAPSQNSSEESQPPEGSQKQNASEPSSETKDDRRKPGEAPDETSGGTGASTNQEPEGGKILIAYFSATNNTEGVAQKLAEGLGADLYEITPEQPYTAEDLDYGNSASRSSVEMNNPEARPAISGSVENMDEYDVVFVGYPIWWGEAPRIMSTFIESYDFSGKTLVAFCTSASSGFGNSDSALRSAADGAAWMDGHRFLAGADSDEVMGWANGLGIPESGMVEKFGQGKIHPVPRLPENDETEKEMAATEGQTEEVPSENSSTEIYGEPEVSENAGMPFADGRPLAFLFASGAGGWGTSLTLYPDGSFDGVYEDGENDAGSDYPRGTTYLCRFTGRFGGMTKLTDQSYSMKLEELDYEEPGREWIERNHRHDTDDEDRGSDRGTEKNQSDGSLAHVNPR